MNKILSTILFLFLAANPVWGTQTNLAPGKPSITDTSTSPEIEVSNQSTPACKGIDFCHKGILRNGKCTCPKGARPQATDCGYTCKIITCPSGKDWDGNKCIVKPLICDQCERINPNTRQCERQLDCIGGNVRAGLCICPKGTVSETTACGHRCKDEPVPPCGKCQKRDKATQQCRNHVECLDGKVINGECSCPAGTNATKTSCGHSCEKIICTGGRSLVGNSCSCPKGLTWNGKLCIRKKPECGSERFWNGKSCECRGELIWNGRNCTKKVEPCPEGNQWNGQSCVPMKIEVE